MPESKDADAEWLRERVAGARWATSGHGEASLNIGLNARSESEAKSELARLLLIANRLDASPIPVGERLPEEGTNVLMFQQPPDDDSDWTSGFFEAGEFHSDADSWKRIQLGERAVAGHVTHWLPLPPPPST